MKLADFEQRVWEIEGIRLVVRGDEQEEVEDYDFKNAAIETWSVAEFLRKRVEKRIGGRKVAMVQGDGEMPHGRVILRTLRASYFSK